MALTYSNLKQENHLKDAIPGMWTFEIGPPMGTTPETYGTLEAALVTTSGTENAVVVHESAVAGTTQCEVWINKFIQADEFVIPSLGITLPSPLTGLGLSYKAKVYIERMGDDPTIGAVDATPSPEQTITYVPGAQDYTATAPIKIAIKDLKRGAYRVVLTFNMYNSTGDGCPFHAFTELGFLEVAPKNAL